MPRWTGNKEFTKHGLISNFYSPEAGQTEFSLSSPFAFFSEYPKNYRLQITAVNSLVDSVLLFSGYGYREVYPLLSVFMVKLRVMTLTSYSGWSGLRRKLE